MTKPWHMARVASRRQLPKPRKMMGPVGRQIDAANNCMNDEEINRPTDKRIWFAMGECSCCRECGYHVCSCAEPEAVCATCGPIPAGKELTHRCPEPIGRDYKFPVQVNIESGQARALKLEASFDDHARHVANHVQLAERLGICGLCHSPDHKFMQCPDRARLYRESLEFEPRRRVCGSCANTVGPGWNYCGDCLKRRRFGE